MTLCNAFSNAECGLWWALDEGAEWSVCPLSRWLRINSASKQTACRRQALPVYCKPLQKLPRQDSVLRAVRGTATSPTREEPQSPPFPKNAAPELKLTEALGHGPSPAAVTVQLCWPHNSTGLLRVNDSRFTDDPCHAQPPSLSRAL